MDASCLCFDGKHFWVTARFLYALTDLVNTVDYDRMSPSYETRLRKYNRLGFAIHIPGFDYQKIDPKIIKFRAENYKDEPNHLPAAQGIDLLLRQFVNNYSYKKSDYSEEYYEDYRDKKKVERYIIGKHYEPKERLSQPEFFPDEGRIYLGKTTVNSGTIVYVLSYYPKGGIEYLIEVFRKGIVPISWKTTQPGEQFTGTFHQTVLADYRNWYPGQFYPRPE